MIKCSGNTHEVYGDLLDRDIDAAVFHLPAAREHLALSRAPEVAVILRLDDHPSRRRIVGRLWYELDVELSLEAGGHGPLLL